MSARSTRPAERGLGARVEVTIERVGSRGDGIGRAAGVPVYVPFALPGDRLEVRLAARRAEGFAALPLSWLVRQERAPARCPHFGECGGCALQHLPDAAYRAWLGAQVADALARRGLVDVPVEPARSTPPGSRRRARLAFGRRNGRIEIGFRRRAGHRIVDLAGCAVLLPGMVALLAPLRALLAGSAMAREGGEVLVSARAGGLDLLLMTPLEPALADREALARFAEAHDLAGIAWCPGLEIPAEPIVRRRAAALEVGGVAVEPPPGAFLQASAVAEALIRDAVQEALGTGARIADLFCGVGTFALPLAAAGRRVRALDGDPALVGALVRAARAAGLADRLTAEVRDLERAPLAGAELAGLDAAVLDPPRAGARSQAKALAGSRVERIAMVSCHPGTFARDARILVDGGCRLLRVQPIDAFPWSGQVELVAAFSRARSGAEQP